MNLEEVKGFNEYLDKKNITLCCAESVTAGLLASTIASIPGASSILKGSIVTYSAELKTSVLGVHPRIIDQYSAESIETTVEMVYGLKRIYPSAKLYVSVTGVASEPVKDSKVIKQLGQIYIAIYYDGEIYKIDEKIKFTNKNEIEIRNNAVDLILRKILEVLKK